MRRAVLFCLAGAALAGCSRGREVDSPAPKTTPPPVAAAPTPPVEKAETVSKVGSNDLSAYAIPIYPGATVNKDLSDVDLKQHQIHVHLDSFDQVRDIAKWYTAQIKATEAKGSKDLGAIRGITSSGYPVDITVAQMDAKAVVRITVDTNRKK